MKNEEIFLDATLDRALSCATFQARLDNGHEIVAFSAPKRPFSELGLESGMRVQVSLSPYDMHKGIIHLHQKVKNHEST